MTSTAALAAPAPLPRTALTLAAAAVVAIASVSLVGQAAILAGANADFPPLMPAVAGTFAVLGLLAASVGWRAVRRVASDPARVLRVLVPVLGLLSFVPDVILIATGFIPGTTVTAGIALMIMHLVVIGIAVPVAARLAPVTVRR